MCFRVILMLLCVLESINICLSGLAAMPTKASQNTSNLLPASCSQAPAFSSGQTLPRLCLSPCMLIVKGRPCCCRTSILV